MSESFTLVVTPHNAFGALATLTVAGEPPRRFTRQEAAIVSRAIEAVAQGASPERQVYMSPIASDHDFDARVESEGLVLGGATLDWETALDLGSRLAAFSGG